MHWWTRRDPHSNLLDEAAALASPPNGGPLTRWIVGGLVAGVPMVYGMVCLRRGHTTLFGRRGGADLTGEAGLWLAVAYIALGAFVHFHYWWGLSPRLSPFSYAGKLVSLLVFVPSFFYAVYRMFVYF